MQIFFYYANFLLFSDQIPGEKSLRGAPDLKESHRQVGYHDTVWMKSHDV